MGVTHNHILQLFVAEFLHKNTFVLFNGAVALCLAHKKWFVFVFIKLYSIQRQSFPMDNNLVVLYNHEFERFTTD